MAELILPRRRFLQGLSALFVAPAIIKASSLMPVRSWAEPRIMVPAANYGFYLPTWNDVEQRFTMQLNDKAPSQMFPETEMTEREKKILADLDRALSAEIQTNIKDVEDFAMNWKNDRSSRVGLWRR